MKLNEIKLPKGAASRDSKRRGRGTATGQGGTAGKGHKGQKARAGKKIRRGFEGGQMPLIRRLPKRGFTNIFKISFEIVNLASIEKLAGNGEITPETLATAGMVKKNSRVKILGDGELTRSVNIKAHAFSKSAQEKIVNAGGTVEVV